LIKVLKSIMREGLTLGCAIVSYLWPVSGRYSDRTEILDSIGLHPPIGTIRRLRTDVIGPIDIPMDPRATHAVLVCL